MSQRGHQRKAVIRQRRALLGRDARDPRRVARELAMERAEELAGALLAPLDEPDLNAMARQRAAVTVLDATFPLATVTAELELPADELGVAAMSWSDMQALAARVLGGDDLDAAYQRVPELAPA